MAFRPYRLAFLPSLFLLQLAGNTQATPVRNDEARLQIEVETLADPGDLIQPATPGSLTPLSVPPAESGRPAATEVVKSARQAPSPPPGEAAPAGESLHGEKLAFSANGPGGAFGESDPLARTLRSLVNMAHRPGAATPSVLSGRVDASVDFSFGEEGQAVIHEAKELVADAIRTLLDPRADDEGRITFSVAGIEGFHIFTDGNTWSLGLGDTVLTRLQADNREGEAAEYQRAHQAAVLADGAFKSKYGPGGRPPNLIPDEVAQLIEDAKDVLEYPLTWFLIALLIIFRAAAKLVAARTAMRQRWHAKRQRVSPHRGTSRNSNARTETLHLDSGPAKS